MRMYREFFDIKKDFFPVINESVIKEHSDIWKSFFPHESFIKLIQNTVSVLERKQNLSLWVEGAYGTGKSHAVLTLKKLLDSSEDETKHYFDNFSLDKDLYNRLSSVKSQGKILTVYVYGSSSINNDKNLIAAIQENIVNSLKEAGIENKATSSFKDGILKWFDEFQENRDYFAALLKNEYSDLFDGNTVEEIIAQLKQFTGKNLEKLLENISIVAEERGIKMLSMNIDDLCSWIKEVIAENHLQSIVFIWDEFTEFFTNNARHLTGFQKLCELSITEPFYFILVTHTTRGLLSQNNKDFIKINDRFVQPHCQIQLPQKIAYQLIGASLEKQKDPEINDEWQVVCDELDDLTKESQKVITSYVKGLTKNELRSIFPIQPYTALVLQFISVLFNSNQRSMFDFIKNDLGDDVKGFQWFIDTVSPYDTKPLLNVDMLWDFFYEKGQNSLANEVKSYLSYYKGVSQNLSSDEKQVLKAILLLGVIYQKTNASVSILLPNKKNLEYALEGSGFDHGIVSNIADKLVRDKILFIRSEGRAQEQYAPYHSENDVNLAEYDSEIDKQTITSSLISEQWSDEQKITDIFNSFTAAINLRYNFKFVASNDFDIKLKQLHNEEKKNYETITAIVCFAKNEEESIEINNKIKTALNLPENDFIFIDASQNYFNLQDYEDYRKNKALAKASAGDNNLKKQYNADAQDSLKRWRKDIKNGTFLIYSMKNKQGEKIANFEELTRKLKVINKEKFPLSLESFYNVLDSMYSVSAKDKKIPSGVICGATQDVKNQYKSLNDNTKLENTLEGAWHVDEYWKLRPNLLISKIKIFVDEFIEKSFKEKDGRVCISEIYQNLTKAPFGFMPCNLSAFILGFVLKEYLQGTYNYTDNLTSRVLDAKALGEAFNEILNPKGNRRTKPTFIEKTTKELRAYYKAIAEIFNKSQITCTTISDSIELIRASIKKYDYPLWILKNALNSSTLKYGIDVYEEVIDAITGIANNENIDPSRTENNYAVKIGECYIAHPEFAFELKKLLNNNNLMHGMVSYVKNYKEGQLINLAQEINDNDNYLNLLKAKFDAQDAKWVWREETVQKKIDEIIYDYKVIIATNKSFPRVDNIRSAKISWLNKCNDIHISYELAKNVLGEEKTFIDLLCKLHDDKELTEIDKSVFLDFIQNKAQLFFNFVNKQLDVFAKVCPNYVSQLDDLSDFYTYLIKESNDIGTLFFLPKKAYCQFVENKLNEYKESAKYNDLLKIWQEKSLSKYTPRQWSKIHKMPIMCLITRGHEVEAQMAFDFINGKKANDVDLQKAIDFINDANFFELMNDEEQLNLIFKEQIIDDCSVILTDLDEVKDYLLQHISNEPYDWWMCINRVREKLEQLANKKYIQGGYEKACLLGKTCRTVV